MVAIIVKASQIRLGRRIAEERRALLALPRSPQAANTLRALAPPVARYRLLAHGCER